MGAQQSTHLSLKSFFQHLLEEKMDEKMVHMILTGKPVIDNQKEHGMFEMLNMKVPSPGENFSPDIVDIREYIKYCIEKEL